LIDYAQLLLLGAIAGFTIFLGLPLAILQNVSSRKKGFLNALSIGILLFLVIDVFSHAWNTATCVASSAFTGNTATCAGSSMVAVNWSIADAATDLIAVFGGNRPVRAGGVRGEIHGKGASDCKGTFTEWT